MPANSDTGDPDEYRGTADDPVLPCEQEPDIEFLVDVDDEPGISFGADVDDEPGIIFDGALSDD